MASAKIFRINYKSDFILTLTSDAGWMTPFCIKFWTGAPSQAYFVGWDGETYNHCSFDPSEPTKLQVQFDDHHLPIGDLKYQVAYHFNVADFPNDTEDEVINAANITTEIDGETYQVMLDFTGETAPEIQFALPAYANEAQRIANEQQRIANETQRIANEETRIQHEQQRIAAEQTRQQNEQQRINQEQARVNEYATLKADAVAATGAANDAAALANQKAQLAADKAALAQAAADLANAKAQLAADKAALAASAAQLANDKAALAQQKAEYAQTQGDYAKDQGDYAKAQGDTAFADHQRAEADHGIAVDDHTQAGNDHTRAESDHGIAVGDHTQAGNDHTRAESDHGIAADDHTQAGTDHTRAESDHGIAVGDHTQAGNDHTRAESDHTRAESDHAAVEVYVDSLGAFDISAYHATGGVLAKYADLTAALGTGGANIPDALRKGGMSVKYVSISDNIYVQYRLIADEFTTDVTKWQGEDAVYDISMKNLVNGSPSKYNDLADALGVGGANVPVSDRESGMAVKYLKYYEATYYVIVNPEESGVPSGGIELGESSDVTTGWHTSSELSGFTNLPSAVGNYKVYYILNSDNTTYTTWRIRLQSHAITKYEWWKYLLNYENTNTGNTNFLNVDNWQGIDSESNPGSKNLIESNAVYSLRIQLTDINNSGSGVSNIGEVYYNYAENVLYRLIKKVGASTKYWAVEPLISGAHYIYQGRIYVWDGNSLNCVGADIADTIGEVLDFSNTGRMLKTDGIAIENSAYDVTGYIRVREEDKLIYLGGNYGTHNLYCSVCGYDENKQNPTVLLPSYEKYIETVIIIPSGIKYIRVTACNNTHTNYYKRYVALKRVYKDYDTEIEAKLDKSSVIDGLDSESATAPLSAKQGKILNETKLTEVEGAVNSEVSEFLIDSNKVIVGTVGVDGKVQYPAGGGFAGTVNEEKYITGGVKRVITDNEGKVIGHIEEDGSVSLDKLHVKKLVSDMPLELPKELVTMIGFGMAGIPQHRIRKKVYPLLLATKGHYEQSGSDYKTEPCLTLADDDAIDGQIPCSYGEPEGVAPISANGHGYASLLWAVVKAVSEKYHSQIRGKLYAYSAAEGRGIGLTHYGDFDNTSFTGELNENGKVLNALIKDGHFEVHCHSMNPRYIGPSYWVDGLDSEFARNVLANGEYHYRGNYRTTSVYDSVTKKNYEVNSDLSGWIETDVSLAKPYCMTELNGYRYVINPSYSFEYQIGEWFRRAEIAGLNIGRYRKYTNWGATRSIWHCRGCLDYSDYGFSGEANTNNVPLGSLIQRVEWGPDASRNNVSTGDYNVYTEVEYNRLKSIIDECVSKNGWTVLTSHANTVQYANYYLDGLTYPTDRTGDRLNYRDDNYPEEWITPLKYEELMDICGANEHNYLSVPPSRLGISSWEDWYPCPGTSMALLYDILRYAIENGVKFVSTDEGIDMFGNLLMVGCTLKNEVFETDKHLGVIPENNTSHCIIGADGSIAYHS